MRSIALIAWYELHHLFLTKRGLLSLSAFGLVWFLILRYVIDSPVGRADVRKSNKYSTSNSLLGFVP